VAHPQVERGGVLEPDRRLRAAERASRQLDDPREHVVETLRRDELPAELEQRARELGLLLLLAVEARLLERDAGLVGDPGEQPQALVGQVVRVAALR